MTNPRDLFLGLTTARGPFAADDLMATARAVGRPLDWVLWCEDFLAMPPLAELDAVKQLGAQPVITWEPWLRETDWRIASSSGSAAAMAAALRGMPAIQQDHGAST